MLLNSMFNIKCIYTRQMREAYDVFKQNLYENKFYLLLHLDLSVDDSCESGNIR